MLAPIAVALGGACGCVCRYYLSVWMTTCCGRAFPYGIFIANILGSFLIGLLMMLVVHKWQLSEAWRLAILVGFLGGFTTFSSFSLDAVQMFQDDVWLRALIYIVLSVLLSVLAAFLGILLAQKLGA